MSAALAFVGRVKHCPSQLMRGLIGSARTIAFADACRVPRASTSILGRRSLGIREPVLTQDLFRQLYVDVRRYQFAKCKRGRVILSLAATSAALGEVALLHKITVSCGIESVGRA